MTDDKVKEDFELLLKKARGEGDWACRSADGWSASCLCEERCSDALDKVLDAVPALQAERDKLSAEVERLREVADNEQRLRIELSYQGDVLEMRDEAIVAKDAAEAKLTALMEALEPFAVKTVDFQGQVRFVGKVPTRADYARARQALAHHSAPVGTALHIVFDGMPGPEGPRFVEVETPDGRSINAGEWRERDDGFCELVIPRMVAPPTTPTSAPVEDVGGLVEPDRWRREKFDAALDRITRKAIAVTQERVCAAMAALAEPGAEDTGLTLFESVMDHPEAELASAPALIMAAIEEVPNWGDSTALVTAHCHAYVLHNDLPDRLAALSPSLIQPQGEEGS